MFPIWLSQDCGFEKNEPFYTSVVSQKSPKSHQKNFYGDTAINWGALLTGMSGSEQLKYPFYRLGARH
jgi:hypothetical protein